VIAVSPTGKHLAARGRPDRESFGNRTEGFLTTEGAEGHGTKRRRRDDMARLVAANKHEIREPEVQGPGSGSKKPHQERCCGRTFSAVASNRG
jgi:hypothetical protein